MKRVIIHTDGSCLKNPGPGGWAAVLALAGTDYRREVAGGYRLTTNNRMEIMGAVQALRLLKEPCLVDLYTDSRYLCDAVTKGWLRSWQVRQWHKADKKPVLNKDLWQALARFLEIHQVKMHWVAGHRGEPDNELCDKLAREQASRINLPEDAGYRSNS